MKGSAVLAELEQLLDPILSPRQPFSDVEASLRRLDPGEQATVLHWSRVIAASNIELSYTHAVSAGQAINKLGAKGVRVWLNEALAIYDREGLYPAMQALRDIDGFAERYREKSYTCYLHEVKPRLDLFIRGLAGRSLLLHPGSEVYTDTEFLYLPESISRYPDKRRNQALYKAMACFLWAQTWYGTFRRDQYDSRTTEERLEAYPDSTRARRYFLVLENIRLLSRIQRDLPGLHREMSALSPLVVPRDRTWKTIAVKLQQPDAGVEETFAALDILLNLSLTMPQTDYLGELKLSEVEARISYRRQQTHSEIAQLLNTQVIDPQQLAQAIDAVSTAKSDEGNEFQGGDSLSGAVESSAINAQLEALLKSMLQDVEQIEEGLLGAIAKVLEQGGGVGDGFAEEKEFKPGSGEKRESMELDEWDYLRQNYREKWCQVTIRPVEELNDGFRQQVETRYPFMARQIRKVFEAMRDQPRYANRQTDGDEIDLDAVVDTYTARRTGEELSERMYIRRQQNERSVAVCLLVDMSGSTKGWINLAMRESLVLLGEALNTLGDAYAILGFSGLTRQRCEIYTVKKFNDKDASGTANRISNIQARDYTRMGFAVRYATRVLLRTDAKHRILLLLSDGKPDDYDGYQGEYGIQDTRKAILEAQGQAINPFSITIDKQAQTYLPRLFGPGQYMILNDVTNLPLKLSEVYRKLSA